LRRVRRSPPNGLTQRADGRLSYRLKTPWRDGTIHVIFEPQELMEKLAVLVPAPRLNLTRFHGILAPAAKRRASVPSVDDLLES
jgi:hypothetical protein